MNSKGCDQKCCNDSDSIGRLCKSWAKIFTTPWSPQGAISSQLTCCLERLGMHVQRPYGRSYLMWCPTQTWPSGKSGISISEDPLRGLGPGDMVLKKLDFQKSPRQVEICNWNSAWRQDILHLAHNVRISTVVTECDVTLKAVVW